MCYNHTMNEIWNPWHGCTRYSEGCKNCYVYRRDDSVGRDASVVHKTSMFDLAVRHGRSGYKIESGQHLFCCMTSDFFIDKADAWRPEIWRMMALRRDLGFTIITKRIERFLDCIPADWGDGYDNVRIISTMENQRCADIRLPILLEAPIKHKGIACEPLLGPIDFHGRLDNRIESLVAGGESGNSARPCDYRWILSLRDQCIEKNISFWFKQTGANFIKDGKCYSVPRRLQHSQARKANINFTSNT